MSDGATGIPEELEAPTSSDGELIKGPADGRIPVVIHYHEIALKRRNRPRFVARLARNIEEALADRCQKRVLRLPGRLMLELAGESDWPLIRERLGRIPGIANFSLAERAPLHMEALSEAVVRSLAVRSFSTFRITTRRANKTFARNSMEVDRYVGARVQAATGAGVNLTEPELNVFVEILERQALFYFDKHKGVGGVPVGTAGTVAALLSGGIDSPVAAFRLLKRGCRIVFIHFHSVPFLSPASQQKVKELAELMTRYQSQSRLYLVAFGDIQRQIMLNTPAPLRVVLYRRFMMRIATALARKRRAQALVTGESLGQVASQTLSNLRVIEDAAGLPLLRPLVGMDKLEIINEARALGSYEISIVPDEDCCQLFIPARPATKSRLREVEAAERRLDGNALVEAAVREAESSTFKLPGGQWSSSSEPESPEDSVSSGPAQE